MEDKPKQSEASRAAAKVDIAAIQDLVKLMSDNDLVELEYAAGDLSIRLSKRQNVVAAPAPVMAAPAAASPPGAAARPAEDKKYLEIVSPMVGTFYAAGSPEASPFMSVGSSVKEDTVVCIIEAMKVFNEIKAGVAGKVVKVCRKNEENVEFGQVLFLVDPA